MKSYSEFLAAGVPVKLTIGGSLLYIQRSSGGAVLDITFHKGAVTQTVVGVGKGFKAGPVGGFDTITFKAAQDSTVEFIVTDGDVNAQFDDASTIIGNDDGQAVPIRMPDGVRLPVDLAGGTVTVNASSVELKQLTTLVSKPSANVMKAAAQVMSDATLKRLMFRNASSTAQIALGGAGVTLDSPIILTPGDIYVESDAAGVAWYAISDEDNAKLTMMGMK